MNQVNELKEVSNIREGYVEKTDRESKFEKLKKLNEKAHRPAKIFAYTFGCAGSLVLGTGMCLAMKVIGNLMPLGIAIGVAGIAMVSVNYLIYKAILKSSKTKYAKEIIALSDELLNK